MIIELWHISTWVIWFTCNSVETAQPGDWTTDPGIVMPEYESGQRVDSLTGVVITPVHHKHTRLHTPLSNICSSPSSIQYTRGLNCLFSYMPHAFFTATVSATNLEYPTRVLQTRRTDIGRHYNSVETAQPIDRTTDSSHVATNLPK